MIKSKSSLLLTAISVLFAFIILCLTVGVLLYQPETELNFRISGDESGFSRNDDYITITKGGEYEISGETAQGSVVIDTNHEIVTLKLNGVNIINNFGPAIYFKNTSESRVVIEDNTSNTLVDSIIRDSEADAVIYSVASLDFSGEGQLSLNGRAQEGIASDSNVIINSGSYLIYAEDDGINASTDFESQIIINGGDITIYSHGDAIDSNGDIIINGGKIKAYADMVDESDGLDFDGELIINGGTIISTGYGHADDPSDKSKQRFVIYKENEVQLRDAPFSVLRTIGDKTENKREKIDSFKLPKEFRHVLYSSPKLNNEDKFEMFQVYE
jgi:hypothetical protein